MDGWTTPSKPQELLLPPNILLLPVGHINAEIARRAQRSVRGREVVEKVPCARTAASSILRPIRGDSFLEGQHLDDDADPDLPVREDLLMVGYLSEMTGRARQRRVIEGTGRDMSRRTGGGGSDWGEAFRQHENS